MKFIHASATALLIVLLCALSASAETAVRFVHTATGTPPVTVRFSALPLFLNRAPLSASSVRSELPALAYQVQIRDTNATSSVTYHSTDMTVTDGMNQTLVFAGKPGSYKTLALAWDKSLPQLGNIKVRFVHASPSVQESLVILVGGSLFFQPLAPMSATNFIEVPLAQASSFSYLPENSNATLAKFTATGKFEAGNVYTVYFVDNNGENEARVVNETSIDEQSPMSSLPRAGVKLTFRTVSTSSAGPQTWTVNELPLFANLASFSASQASSAYAEGSPVIAVHPPNDLSTVLAEKTLETAGANRFVLASYGVANTMQILALPASTSVPSATEAFVRFAHTAPGIGAVEIVRGSDPVITSTAYGTASSFANVAIQQHSLRVRDAATKNILADFSFTPLATHIYTLFLTMGGSGVEVRLFDEVVPSAQSPMPVLNVQSTGSAKLRAVNLVASKSIEIGTDKTTITEKLDYAHAEAVVPNFVAGNYTFDATDASAPFDDVASVEGQIANGGDYLLVFFGQPAKARGTLISNPKIKLPKDSVLVRFMNAAPDIDNLRVVNQTSGAIIADKIAYGDISDYKALPRGERLYSIETSAQQAIGTMTDNYAAHDVITIFLVRENGNLIGYVLPDEAPEAFRPMPQYQSTVSVGEPGMAPARVAAPQPNPVREQTSMSLSLSVPSEVVVQYVDMSGRVVKRLPAAKYPAGEQTLTLDCSSLSNGMYMVLLRINGEVYSYSLTVAR